MSLGIYGDGPLTVDFLLESFRPQVNQNKSILPFTQTFDLLVKNRSDHDMYELVVLHSSHLIPPPAASGQDTVSAWHHGEWLGRRMYRRPPIIGPEGDLPAGIVQFSIAGFDSLESTGVTMEEYIATLAMPRAVRVHPLIGAAEHSLFGPGWPTPLLVEFSEPIRPYDPTDPRTSYLIPLTFHIDAVPPIAAHRLTGPNRSLMLARCFDIKSPELLWYVFADRLSKQATPPHANAVSAQRLYDGLIHNGVMAPDHTTRMRDIRIGILTDDRCFVHDVHEIGEVAFGEVRRLVDPQDVTTHVWLGGATHYQRSDPTEMARHAWDYCVRQHPREVSVEEVSLALSPPFFRNAVTVIEALVGAGLFELDNRAVRIVESKLRDDPLSYEAEIRRRVALAQLSDAQAFRPRPFQIIFSIVSFANLSDSLK